MMLRTNDLLVDHEQLAAIMHAFYTVTHIKSTLYDTGFHEILTYPAGPCDFCRIVRSRYLDRCTQTDLQAFANCAERKEPIRYCCHMGLYEVISPLRNGDEIIGYIMFGQMLQKERKGQIIESISQVYSDLAPVDVLQNALNHLQSKSQEQIEAATLLMQTCISYLLLHRIVRVNRGNFVEELNRYLEAHISDEITVPDLYHYFGMSRSSFYTLAKQCLDCNIMQYVKKARIDKAKDLLRDTDRHVTQISEMVGFGDYNYFLRVFKHEAGQSCRKYRLSFRD